MKKVILVLAVVVMGLAGSVQASLTYSGFLSSADDSLIVQGSVWNNRLVATSLGWVVTETGSGQWHYGYTLMVPAGTIGRVIFETSPTFTTDNMSSVTSCPVGWAGTVSVGTHCAADNSGMPADMYGIRFCSTVDPTVLVIGFDSDRSPVWGDFYASGYFTTLPAGASTPGWLFNSVYNAGFSDADPLTGPHDGSLQYHLLVPDTVSYIPAPGAIVLCSLGAVLVGQLRRRRVL